MSRYIVKSKKTKKYYCLDGHDNFFWSEDLNSAYVFYSLSSATRYVSISNMDLDIEELKFSEIGGYIKKVNTNRDIFKNTKSLLENEQFDKFFDLLKKQQNKIVKQFEEDYENVDLLSNGDIMADEFEKQINNYLKSNKSSEGENNGNND